MDTTKIEYTAEDLIAHSLQRAGILVAKPKFDREGADLLAFLELKDGVKFCRIQAKGRTLEEKGSSSVKIPKSYVTPSLVVFLYIDTGDLSAHNLYCFFHSDVTQWNSSEDNYTLSLSASTFKENLSFYEFNKHKVELIETVIRVAESKGEFRRIVYGSGAVQAQPATVSGTINVISKQDA